MRKIRVSEPNDSNDTSAFKGLLKRATTEMLVLLTLRDKPMYIYEMMNMIKNKSNGYLQFNTLYIAIYRLKELKFVEESAITLTDDNRTRVYYSITETGRDYLNNMIKEYENFSGIMGEIIYSDNAKIS